MTKKKVIHQSPTLIACKGTDKEELFGYDVIEDDGKLKLNLTTFGAKGRIHRLFIEDYPLTETAKAKERFDLYVSVSEVAPS